MRSFITVVALFFFVVSTGSCVTMKPVTGTWRTESAVPYLVERSAHRPQGGHVPHEDLELVERFASGLSWSEKMV